MVRRINSFDRSNFLLIHPVPKSVVELSYDTKEVSQLLTSAQIHGFFLGIEIRHHQYFHFYPNFRKQGTFPTHLQHHSDVKETTARLVTCALVDLLCAGVLGES